MRHSRDRSRVINKKTWLRIISVVEAIRSSSGNIANPVFADLMDYKYRTTFGKIKLVIRRLFWVALPSVKVDPKYSSVIAFSASNRVDYEAILDSFSEKVPGINILTCVGTRFSLSLDLASIKVLISHRKNFKKLTDKSSHCEKVMIYLALLHAIRVEKKMPQELGKDKLSDKSAYVFLNAANAIESSWARCFLSNEGEVISLQHGIYVDFVSENQIPFDFINYCNVTAQKFVGWSTIAVSVVKKYMPEMTCHVGGRLGKHDLTHFTTRMEWEDDGRRICVLGRDFHFEHNVKLLKLASSLGEVVDVCFHPNSNVKRYQMSCNFALRVVSKSDFKRGVDVFLVGNSSMYYDLILSGHAAALYSAGNNDFQGFHSFENAAELKKLVFPAGANGFELAEDQVKALNESVGLGVDNYHQLFAD